MHYSVDMGGMFSVLNASSQKQCLANLHKRVIAI